MNFIVFQGYLGSGKTTGAVYYANYIKQLVPDTVLYSNFGMKNARPFTSLYDLLEIADNPSSIVVLDETHIDLDSRSFNTNHVKFISESSFYLRKIRCTFIMTSPLFENLDSRIRGITNMLVFVEKDYKNFYYERWDIQSRRFLGRNKVNKDFVYSLNLFDTNGIVTRMQVPENRQEFDKFLLELKRRTDNFYIGKQSEGQKAIAF